ncbi:serine protease 1 [Drosophila mojavensis]|uniref:Peptidase S1 domain-containing protein n=1 Tax=Drosophila mojavensis TaxID=7230 RepID=B4KZK0_DROMO|nr:serine protease 1 [Drosophila mojavensis]EDW17927.1 uncharacterized protein Dmoj_GI12958 [Drosophila mojavensis]
MKVLVVFALAVAYASGSALRAPYEVNVEPELRNVYVPAVDGLDGRITNGYDARPDQFPYQAGLSLKIGNSAAWCGGSVIGHEWILTAAHCTDGVDSIDVHLGSTIRTSPKVKYTVGRDRVIIHEGWNSKTVLNDISLIRIPYTDFNDAIRAVDLPRLESHYSTYVNDEAVASGWGRTSDSSNSVASHLQYADLRIISNDVCKKTFPLNVRSSNICVSTSAAVSTCNGDSGGPLVLKHNRELVGVTSFGSSAGCEKQQPAAFTRVTSYLDWIKDKSGISR